METDPFDSIPMGSAVNLTMRLSFDEATEEEANWPRDREERVLWSDCQLQITLVTVTPVRLVRVTIA